ncbi:MAG: DUF4115 domain-containing protein [Deltaproteobacteria bacterium]|nr:DUF4115 domain-containing protein [Deltaproteobacteria bacterium]
MNIDKENLSFGRLLKSLRRDKNMTLDDVFEITRVSKTILELIEKEDHERLPAAVLVKNFLRTYADAVGADRDEVVKLYLLSNQNASRNLRLEASIDKPYTRLWPRFLLAVSALAVIICLSIFMMEKEAEEPLAAIEPQIESVEPLAIEEESLDNSFNEQRLNEQPLNEQLPVVQEKLSEAEEVPVKKVLVKKVPVEVVPEELLLRIEAIEETWLKVIIDSDDAMEYTVKPGDTLKLEASSGYNILIGNAAGVKLFLNDKSIKVPGRSGQVVTIQLP